MTLLFTIGAFAVISYIALTRVIAPAFDELEMSAARTDLVRAQRAIDSDIETLQVITADWSPWDDIHKYAQGQYPEFIATNITPPTLANLELDLVAIYALDSDLKFGLLLIDGQQRSVDELGILGADDFGSLSLTEHQSIDDTIVGIVNTRFGPMLICSNPILHSDDTGPIAGTIVMAQFLSESRLVRLRERTEVYMDWIPIEESDRLSDFDQSSLARGDVLVDSNESRILSSTMLFDIFGAPILVLSAETPRDISALGRQTVTGAMLLLLIGGVLATIVMWLLLRRIILSPIESLAGHIDEIRASGDLSRKLELDSDDEIGALAAQFDNLTSEVHEARQALLEQSFKAGKADTAAEVLHNIRNAMTPMVNGIERVSRAFRVADGLRIGEATQQLVDTECPPERKAKLIEYIDASFERIKNVGIEATEDMKIVMSQSRQVEGILSDQEQFANVAPVDEDIVVDEVVEEAAHVIPKKSKSKIDIDMGKELIRYRVRAHRVGLLQVLGNLILNACESIQRGNASDGRISLSASEAVIEDRPMVRLTIRDNGCGFSEDVSKRIFQRGYTSKIEGSATGLGLHWCANAVAGMGGRIFAESQGTGKGAEFHVLLPAAEDGRR
ncbi:MAG: HAMP domain-containing protein [Proteobacteria bacterium]|nr:HAMP domain-containing protein [Pseudomonadota bacterium]